jgi:hypothetical protein
MAIVEDEESKFDGRSWNNIGEQVTGKQRKVKFIRQYRRKHEETERCMH